MFIHRHPNLQLLLHRFDSCPVTPACHQGECVPLVVSEYILELSIYLKTYSYAHEPGKLLVYSTARGAIVKLDSSVLADARDRKLSDQEQALLAKIGILVPDRLAEQEQMRTLFDEGNRRSRQFTALVTMNLDCNLACGYCYEDHFRGKRYMTLETADLLVQYVSAQIERGLDVTLDFYGGEALLSLAMMKYIAARVRHKASEAGTQASFNLVSNATLLTREVAQELKELGFVSVRFTIDGPPDVHNLQRPFVSGKGSFDRIIENLDQTCDILSVQLGGNYTRDNYRQFPLLLDLLTERGISPDRLGSVLFSPVTPKAGEAGLSDFSSGCACPNDPWLIEASLFLRHEILRRGFNAPKPRLVACMVEFENDLVIGYDGSLYKCPAFMGWEDMRIGTLADGISDYRISHKMDIWKNDECLNCPYLPLCFGGCRFLRRVRTGEIDGVDCRREYLDAALEQILLQDLTLRKRP